MGHFLEPRWPQDGPQDLLKTRPRTVFGAPPRASEILGFPSKTLDFPLKTRGDGTEFDFLWTTRLGSPWWFSFGAILAQNGAQMAPEWLQKWPQNDAFPEPNEIPEPRQNGSPFCSKNRGFLRLETSSNSDHSGRPLLAAFGCAFRSFLVHSSHRSWKCQKRLKSEQKRFQNDHFRDPNAIPEGSQNTSLFCRKNVAKIEKTFPKKRSPANSF